MNHFSAAEWIDFANHVVPASKKQDMEDHLKTGCKRCSEELSMWQRVQSAAADEANYEPPGAAVGIAKAAFAGSPWAEGKKTEAGTVTVLFDSLLQPVFEGARSSGAGARQLLYRADPYQLDLLLERQHGDGVVMVTGQLLNLSHPEMVGSNVQVKLSNLRGAVVEAVTDQFGEFRGAIKTNGDLEVQILGANDRQIRITLRDALGRSGDSKKP
jgi:hypothetical protein